MSKTTATPKTTMFDPEMFVGAHKRNMEAFTSVAQILTDGMKALTQRQTEIMQASLSEFVAASESMFKNGVPEIKPVGEQVGQAKATYEKAFANAEELSNIAFKAQTEAMNVLGDCARANLETFKKAAA